MALCKLKKVEFMKLFVLFDIVRWIILTLIKEGQWASPLPVIYSTTRYLSCNFTFFIMTIKGNLKNDQFQHFYNNQLYKTYFRSNCYQLWICVPICHKLFIGKLNKILFLDIVLRRCTNYFLFPFANMKHYYYLSF